MPLTYTKRDVPYFSGNTAPIANSSFLIVEGHNILRPESRPTSGDMTLSFGYETFLLALGVPIGYAAIPI